MTAVLAPPRRLDAVRQWTPLGLIFLSVGVATAMASPFLTLFLTDAVHAGSAQVTAFLVAAPLSSVLLSTLVGHWSDKHPQRRRQILIAAALTGALGAGLTTVVRDYWILLALTVTATAAAASMLPQLFAYARTALLGSDSAAMTMSTLRMLFSLSWVAGPFVATVLIGVGGFAASYGFSAAMYLISALLTWKVLPDVTSPFLIQVPAALEVEGETGPIVPSPRPDASRKVIALTVLALILIMCAGNLGVQSMALFVSTSLHGGIGDAGVIMGIGAGLEIPLMLGFGALTARVPLRRLVLAGPLCTLLYGVAVFLSTHVWQVGAAQVFSATAVALLQGLGVTYVQEMLPGQPGRASTLFTNAFPAGAMLAGPILGVAGHIGYRSVYGIGACLAAVAFVLLAIARPAPVARD